MISVLYCYKKLYLTIITINIIYKSYNIKHNKKNCNLLFLTICEYFIYIKLRII